MKGTQNQQQVDKLSTKNKFSLLYVDDDVTNLNFFKENFKKLFNIYTSTNHNEAISILEREEIQIIIMDQLMPEMTGIQFLEKISPDYPDVIKIILTGCTDVETIKDGINRCGIYKCVTDPWDFDEMRTVLEKAINNSQKSIESEEYIKKLKENTAKLENKVWKRNRELNILNKRLIDDIRYAGLLQKSMLPNDRYMRHQFQDHLMIFETKYLFSQEFMWTTRHNFRSEDYTVVSLIEFNGKGIIGSLKTLIADSIFNYLIHDRKVFHSGEIINELQRELDTAGSEELKCDLKVSVAVFDHNAGKLHFSGIKQDMIVFNGQKYTLLKGNKDDCFENVISENINIESGASYYMYTNGYYIQKNEDGVQFSYEKFREMLKLIQNKSMANQKKFLVENLQTWKTTAKLNDDISIVGFKLD